MLHVKLVVSVAFERVITCYNVSLFTLFVVFLCRVTNTDNGPSAVYDHMVQNSSYGRTRYALGHPRQIQVKLGLFILNPYAFFPGGGGGLEYKKCRGARRLA